MIIDIFGIEKLVFDDARNNILVIEDVDIFSKIVTSLYFYGEEENDLIILDDNKALLKNRLFIITDLLGFDFQTKTIINKLNSIICKQIMSNSELELDIIQKINNINQLIDDYTFDLNLEIRMKEEKQIENYIKYLGLSIECNEKNLYEKMINIIELISELFPDLYVICLNQLSFFNKQQIIEIFKYKNYKKCNILFIENRKYELESICATIIDQDYYVYNINY